MKMYCVGKYIFIIPSRCARLASEEAGPKYAVCEISYATQREQQQTQGQLFLAKAEVVRG